MKRALTVVGVILGFITLYFIFEIVFGTSKDLYNSAVLPVTNTTLSYTGAGNVTLPSGNTYDRIIIRNLAIIAAILIIGFGLVLIAKGGNQDEY